MKKIFSALYRLMCHSSLAFTAVLVFFWLFMDSGNNKSLAYEHITEFIKFSLIFGATSLITYIPRLPSPLKTLIHFIINTISFVTFFTLSREGSQSAKFVAIIIFVLVYAVVTLISTLVRRIPERKTEEDVQDPAAEQ